MEFEIKINVSTLWWKGFLLYWNKHGIKHSVSFLLFIGHLETVSKHADMTACTENIQGQSISNQRKNGLWFSLNLMILNDLDYQWLSWFLSEHDHFKVETGVLWEHSQIKISKQKLIYFDLVWLIDWTISIPFVKTSSFALRDDLDEELPTVWIHRSPLHRAVFGNPWLSTSKHLQR